MRPLHSDRIRAGFSFALQKKVANPAGVGFLWDAVHALIYNQDNENKCLSRRDRSVGDVMTPDAQRFGAWRFSPGRLCATMMKAAGLLVAALIVCGAHAQEPPGLRNHLLGISNCPPWTPRSDQVCKHSVKKVVRALAPRTGTGPDSIHLLVNEGASATALKRKATELANQLGANDRLIIYLNLPLALAGNAPDTDAAGYVLELWAEQEPGSAQDAIADGTWVSASAFAAMIHTIPAAEVILILDTNNAHAVNLGLLDQHAVDLKDRPEALVSSAGAGQAANYSADRTISLFAKHLAFALNETEGSLLDVVKVAAGGTRQAAIPICADLVEHKDKDDQQAGECAQVPEIDDPDGLLDRTDLVPLADTGTD